MTSRAAPVGLTLDAGSERGIRAALDRIERRVGEIRRRLRARPPCDEILGQLAAVREAIRQLSVRVLDAEH